MCSFSLVLGFCDTKYSQLRERQAVVSCLERPLATLCRACVPLVERQPPIPPNVNSCGLAMQQKDVLFLIGCGFCNRKSNKLRKRKIVISCVARTCVTLALHTWSPVERQPPQFNPIFTDVARPCISRMCSFSWRVIVATVKQRTSRVNSRHIERGKTLCGAVPCIDKLMRSRAFTARAAILSFESDVNSWSFTAQSVINSSRSSPALIFAPDI